MGGLEDWRIGRCSPALPSTHLHLELLTNPTMAMSSIRGRAYDRTTISGATPPKADLPVGTTVGLM